MRKIIIIVVFLALILGILFFFFGSQATELIRSRFGQQTITLKVWGLWEEEDVVKPIIEEYQKLNSNIKIEYVYQLPVNYRTRVQSQLTDLEGPDIFMIHNTWLPMFLKNNSVSPLPQEVMTRDDYRKIFYPIAYDSFSNAGQIYALPMEVDGLAMYYNEELIDNAGVSIPRTWNEFIDTANSLTQRDESGRILVAGAALGTTNNVDHWPDIIGLLFFQNPDADLTHPDTDRGVEVLSFYTSFVTNPSRKVWDIEMDVSTQAFYTGKLAFYFAPSWRAHDLKAANPQLKFKTAPVPQLPGGKVGWGTFWGYTVSGNSKYQKQAWEFLKYLTSADIEKKLYREAANTRLFGEPYSRMDLQRELVADPIVGSFILQTTSYKSWYLASNTFDNGLNDNMIKYFEDAVNTTIQGGDVKKALQTTSQGVQQVLDQFVNPPASVPINK